MWPKYKTPVALVKAIHRIEDADATGLECFEARAWAVMTITRKAAGRHHWQRSSLICQKLKGAVSGGRRIIEKSVVPPKRRRPHAPVPQTPAFPAPPSFPLPRLSSLLDTVRHNSSAARLSAPTRLSSLHEAVRRSSAAMLLVLPSTWPALRPTPTARAPPPLGRARDCSRPTFPLPRISKSRPELLCRQLLTANESTNTIIEQLLQEVCKLKSSTARPVRASLLDQVDLQITSVDEIENLEEMLKEKSFATAMSVYGSSSFAITQVDVEKVMKACFMHAKIICTIKTMHATAWQNRKTYNNCQFNNKIYNGNKECVSRKLG
ncbi:hypothetical protein CAPTEDRAFT_211610 [Capitella teleta]|uniref:Uncharacterized protein n=1 Tax=Capitella teleta TaxID=283909 RepID=R7UGI2_CAPTE|nr:hypothetical protein CAPTEDRAFT_211610 [Capitella teleta]|eukprot:ELU05198.1 hypothetical protein CAPTEDRAFT_211610 [Capitella teleta]